MSFVVPELFGDGRSKSMQNPLVPFFQVPAYTGPGWLGPPLYVRPTACLAGWNFAALGAAGGAPAHAAAADVPPISIAIRVTICPTIKRLRVRPRGWFRLFAARVMPTPGPRRFHGLVRLRRTERERR